MLFRRAILRISEIQILNDFWRSISEFEDLWIRGSLNSRISEFEDLWIRGSPKLTPSSPMNQKLWTRGSHQRSLMTVWLIRRVPSFFLLVTFLVSFLVPCEFISSLLLLQCLIIYRFRFVDCIRCLRFDYDCSQLFFEWSISPFVFLQCLHE